MNLTYLLNDWLNAAVLFLEPIVSSYNQEVFRIL